MPRSAGLSETRSAGAGLAEPRCAGLAEPRSAGLAEQRSAGLAEPRSDGPAVLEVSRSAGLAVSRSGGSRPPGQGGWDEGIPIQQAERDQHKNWFAELVLVVLVVLVVVNEKNWKPFEVKSYLASLYMYKLGSQTSQVVVYMKKAFQSEELFGDDKAGSRRPDWPAGARTVSDSMIEASSGGRCDSDYK